MKTINLSAVNWTDSDRWDLRVRENGEIYLVLKIKEENKRASRYKVELGDGFFAAIEK